MRALVTGVTGQDGWYLSELLIAEGVEVHGLVAHGTADDCPPGVHPVTGDMRDTASLRAAVQAAEPDEVYHLASISSVAQSWREPELVAEVNGVGTVRLLAAVADRCAATGETIRVVHAGSAEIFGDATAPQSESTAIGPTNPYGAAKAFAQHAVAVYRAQGLGVSSLILYNHESPRRPPSFVTRKITQGVARIARGGAAPLELGNLDARRDWSFAGDVAAAMPLAARAAAPGDFVIASGISHSVREFVAAAFAHVGIDDWSRHVRVDGNLTRAGDAQEQRGDTSRAREVLGWRPHVDFATLVAMMVDADLRAIG